MRKFFVNQQDASMTNCKQQFEVLVASQKIGLLAGKTDKGVADEEDSLLEDKDDGPEDLLNERDQALEFSEEVIVAPSSVEQGRVVEERFFLKKVEHMLQQDEGGCRQMFVVHDLFEMINHVLHCYKDDSWDEQIGFVASLTPKWFSIVAVKRGVKSEKLRSQQENLKQVLYESFHSSFQDLSSSTQEGSGITRL